jgi:hypothetical protein
MIAALTIGAVVFITGVEILRAYLEAKEEQKEQNDLERF